MSGYLDKMRKSQTGGKKAPQAPKETTANVKSEKKDKPEVVIKEVVGNYKCGHTCHVNVIRNANCPQCAMASRKQKREKDILRAKEKPKKQNKPWSLYPSPLPHGSAKALTWDAEKGLWFGTLEVPGAPLFGYSDDTEQKCVHGLHAEWVKWAMAQKKQKLQPLEIIDDRSPEQLKADGDDRWQDGSRYTPPHLKGEERRLFIEQQDRLDSGEAKP